jgi:hypothetical protein
MHTQGKPVAALQEFVRRLGWPKLRYREHVIELTNVEVAWYESGVSDGSRDDLFLQINECPIGQAWTYVAAVYAIRYRICTGWHSMRLTADLRCDASEVHRLDGWLHRRWFETSADRRQFRGLHPECSGWTWKRIRNERLPYEVLDAGRCIVSRTE